MAKVVATYDTEDKSFSVMMDGSPMEGVESFNVSKSYMYKDPMFDMSMSVNDGDSGMMHRMSSCASQGATASKINGIYIEPSMTKAQSDICEYFAKRKRGDA